MKKIILSIAYLFAIHTLTYAQQNAKKSLEVPAVVMQSFQKHYPNVKAKWDKENGDFEAGFKQNGNEWSVLYASDGTLKETEVEIPISQLPKGVVEYITTHKLGKIKEAAKITKANGEVIYEAEVKGGDALFDSTGKFIRMSKD